MGFRDNDSPKSRPKAAETQLDILKFNYENASRFYNQAVTFSPPPGLIEGTIVMRENLITNKLHAKMAVASDYLEELQKQIIKLRASGRPALIEKAEELQSQEIILIQEIREMKKALSDASKITASKLVATETHESNSSQQHNESKQHHAYIKKPRISKLAPEINLKKGYLTTDEAAELSIRRIRRITQEIIDNGGKGKNY